MGNQTFRQVIYLILVIVIVGSLPHATASDSTHCVIFSETNIVDYEDEFYSQLLVATEQVPYDGEGTTLESVSVSKEGWFVLTISDVEFHHVIVYDESCQFRTRYILEESGTVLSTFDDTDHQIILYPVRRDVLIKVDLNGNYLAAANADDISISISDLSALNEFNVALAGNVYSFSGMKLFNKNSQTFTVTDANRNILYSYTPPIGFKSYLPFAVPVLAVLAFWFKHKRAKRTVKGTEGRFETTEYEGHRGRSL